LGDGEDAGLGGELGGLEALADIAELGEDLRGADASGAREGHDDAPVREGLDGVLDTAGELADRRDEGDEADDLALGIGLRLAGEALRSGAQAGEQLFGGAPARVAMLGHEGLQALLPEALRALGRRERARKARANGLSKSAKTPAAPGQKPRAGCGAGW
jgi:hypothetical protein